MSQMHPDELDYGLCLLIQALFGFSYKRWEADQTRRRLAAPRLRKFTTIFCDFTLQINDLDRIRPTPWLSVKED